MFQTERDLVISLIDMLENNKVKIKNIKDFFILQEVDGMIGRPDILLKSKTNTKIITIEVKLKNWKRALQQAYKYRSFSDIAYICMDEKNVKPALENLDLFKKCNIGLLTINSKNEIKIYYEPTMDRAFVENLRDVAESKFNTKYGNDIMTEKIA